LLKIFSDNLINRNVCLLLVTVFLFTFPTGVTAMTFCLDEQENHVVDQNFYLADCHSALEASLAFSEEHSSVLVDGKNNDCTDVSLTNANILNRPPKTTLPSSSKVILFYAQPNGLVGPQHQVTEYFSSALSKPLFVLPDIEAHRTVVLLI
jgi:hypothetical protein